MKTQLENYGTLIEKLKEERRDSRDYLTDTRNLTFKTDEDGSKVYVEAQGERTLQYGITELAEQQVAARLKIPMQYYRYMKENQPDLLDTNVNTWFQNKPETRFVRTLKGNVRAFLSDRYQVVDNLEIAAKALTVMNENQDWVQGSLAVTDEHLYIKVLSERFSDEISVGDTVQAGFVVSNSEVGLGCVRVEPLIYRLVCTNGMIVPDKAHRKYHVGQKQEIDENYALEIFRTETIETSNKAYLMKIEDIIRGALNESVFRDTVARMRKAKEMTIDVDPVETARAVGKTFNMNEAEIMTVGANYLNDNDFTQYGLANAVTKTANTRPAYERATEFEKFGGLVLDMDLDAMLKNVDSRKLKN